ncbi:MAG: hypothetical protein NVS3B1_12850 [Marmoricola sp.]
MAQEVINALFAGDSQELLPRYAAGIQRFQSAGGPVPEQVAIAHSPEGLHVTLIWPEGVSHEVLGTHMRGLIRELGLPLPQVNHGTLVTTSWASLAQLAS